MDEPVDFNREKDVFGLDKRDVHPFTESTDESPKRIKRIKRIKRKSPWLAALLSLMMMGLGHVYAGKIKKGILCYLGFLIIVFSIRFLAFQFYIFVGVLALVFLYWVFVIVDAFRTVSRNPEPQRQKYDRWYTYLLIIAVQAILLEIAPKSALDRNTPINFAHIPTPAMRPTLKVGDYIAFHRTKNIQQNHPVLFKYPKDTVTMYIKRCIGIPGDNVAIT
ncbi:MAG: signal peptidase I, partial [Flavobacteriales bacterium]|nr:signal peptidase I [Flavobacteriales bacterium]